MEKIREFTKKNSINGKTVSDFAKMVLEYELGEEHKGSVQLKKRWLSPKINGYVRLGNKKDNRKPEIYINVVAFLHYKRKHSSLLVWLFLYATIVHELEHIRLDDLYEKKVEPDYITFMAALCQYDLHHMNFYEKVIDRVLLTPGYMSHENATYNLPELVCTYKGVKKAKAALGDALCENEKKIVNRIIEGTKFLRNHMEVVYIHSAQPYFLFAKTIMRIQNRLKRTASLLEHAELLLNVFGGDGTFGIVQYYERRSQNRELFDGILIHLFILGDFNWEKAFEDNQAFFYHMEMLANEYCKESIEYIKNMHVGESVVNKSILNDIAAVYLRNVEQINKLIDKFGMKRTEGTLISLYS